MIFLILIIGCIYSLPNLYKEDFLISIHKNISNNVAPDYALLCDIKQILINENIINKTIYLNTDGIHITFFFQQEQLHAYKILSSIFLEKYSISLNKKSSMPYWLSFIQAKPIKLGLDLKGGISLIIRVDTETILNKFQEQYIELIRSVLTEKTIPYIKINKSKNYEIEIDFQDSNNRNQTILHLSKLYNNLVLHPSLGSNQLHIAFSEKYINSMYEYAIQQNSIILHHRIHQLKIIHPLIQRCGTDRIIIELPGIQNITQVKKILSTAVNLEFHLVNTTINKNNINNNFIPEDTTIKSDIDGNIIPLYKHIILTGEHIINSNVDFDEYYRPQVNISLDNIGSSIISNFTKNNIGKIIATLFIEYKDNGKKNSQGKAILDKYEKIINMATIQSQLNHNFCIIGIDNINDARHLSSLLKMGSLATPIFIEEERIIEPTLGKKNINQGIIACGLGILTSICFMIIWYRYFGLIAGAALIINLILITGIMSLLPGITLTMPSIAGIVLTLSVAIDANVLINERIKEEIKQGKPIQYAIYVGYQKAFTSIVDANITTVITSIILYIFSIEPIRGFALITIIGVGTSMFTSIIGTRTLVNLFYGKKHINKLSI